MNNIIEQAFQETIAYVNTLNLQNYFSALLDRYSTYYKKGIYVHFNFGSSTIKDCFGHYVYRHNLDKGILDDMPKDYKRNTRMQIYHVTERLTKKSRDLHSSVDKWRKELRSLENKVGERMLAGVNDKQYSGVQKALNSLYTHYLDASKEEAKRADNEVQAVRAMDKRYKRIWEEFQNAEVEVLKLALEFYMKRLSEKLAMFFDGYKVSLRYSRKEIIKKYIEKKTQHNHAIPLYPDPNHELSMFMREMFGFLDTAKKSFVIKIYKEDEVYRLTTNEAKNYFKLVIEPKGSEHYDPFNRSIMEPLSEFLGKYEGLGLLLQSFSEIKDKFGEESEAVKAIRQLIHMAYPREVLLRYDELQKELVEKRKEEQKKKPKWMSDEEAIKKMVENFSEFQISFGIKPDEDMNFIMNRFGSGKEEYFIHYIDEISKGSDVLRLGVIK